MNSSPGVRKKESIYASMLAPSAGVTNSHSRLTSLFPNPNKDRCTGRNNRDQYSRLSHSEKNSGRSDEVVPG